MRHNGWRAAALLGLMAALTGGLTGCPEGPPPSDGVKVDVGGYDIFYRDSGAPAKGGQGEPTVILMSGLNDNLKVWNKVYTLLSPTRRVVAYDRGGVGFSDEGFNPRTGTIISDELHAFLEAADIPPPYVLCAHSFAGLFARLYVRDYPGEVVGLVMIDTTHEDQYLHQALLLKPRAAQMLETIDVVTENALAGVGATGEWMNRNNTFNEIRANRYLPDIPLYFLAEDFQRYDILPNDSQLSAQTLQLELYQDLSRLVPRGILEVVPNVGHDIHEQAPDVVVKAINAVITGEGF